MIPASKDRLIDLAWKIGPLILAVGITYASLRSDVAGKLETIRFVSDSIRRDAINEKYDLRLQRIDDNTAEALRRIREMQCDGKPSSCR